jgi:methionyl-tRNA formyltransferase
MVVGHTDAPGMRRVRRRLGSGGTLILGRAELEDPAVHHALRSMTPDVILSFFWPRRVPPSLLALPTRGAFGTHPSLLPRWRGPDPYFWALRRGDTETGVTLHRLGPEYDTGLVVAQRRVAIRDGDDAWTLARRLDAPALELLVACVRDLHAGRPLEGVPQREDEATSAPVPTETDLAIDWRQPAEDIVRLVRAASPWPGATALLGQVEAQVVAARVSPLPPPAALRPAEAWSTPAGVAVRAGSGAVILERVRSLDGTPVLPEGLLGLRVPQGEGPSTG